MIPILRPIEVKMYLPARTAQVLVRDSLLQGVSSVEDAVGVDAPKSKPKTAGGSQNDGALQGRWRETAKKIWPLKWSQFVWWLCGNLLNANRIEEDLFESPSWYFKECRRKFPKSWRKFSEVDSSCEQHSVLTKFFQIFIEPSETRVRYTHFQIPPGHRNDECRNSKNLTRMKAAIPFFQNNFQRDGFFGKTQPFFSQTQEVSPKFLLCRIFNCCISGGVKIHMDSTFLVSYSLPSCATRHVDMDRSGWQMVTLLVTDLSPFRFCLVTISGIWRMLKYYSSPRWMEVNNVFCVVSDTGCSLLNARKSLQNCSWKAIFHVWNSIFSGVLGRVRYQKNWKYTLGSLSLTLLVNYDLYIPLYCMHKYIIYI